MILVSLERSGVSHLEMLPHKDAQELTDHFSDQGQSNGLRAEENVVI